MAIYLNIKKRKEKKKPMLFFPAIGFHRIATRCDSFPLCNWERLCGFENAIKAAIKNSGEQFYYPFKTNCWDVESIYFPALFQ